jgi:hypothetical protein
LAQKGKTKSKYNRTERKQRAFRYFLRGYTKADVAKNLKVSWDTADRYHKEWKQRAEEAAESNPAFLKDILVNTMQTLEELDEVRRETWHQYEECETHNLRQGYLSLMIKAQDQRARLLQLFGVKQEYFAHVQSVQLVQAKLIEFMRRHLCETDRTKMEQFFTNELATYIEAEVIEEEQFELATGSN